MTPSQPTTWKVEKFENGQAVLSGGGQELRIARSQLADGIKEGEIVTAEFFPLKDAQKRRDNLAKALLEEIFNGE
ncbi:MAG TPA: hypothetical protein VMQ44_01750 [Candidatus Saccharimonadales bacterium]|nr:hypothetical protein [Candidatus Saccharimonadales bacterium]